MSAAIVGVLSCLCVVVIAIVAMTLFVSPATTSTAAPSTPAVTVPSATTATSPPTSPTATTASSTTQSTTSLTSSNVTAGPSTVSPSSALVTSAAATTAPPTSAPTSAPTAAPTAAPTTAPTQGTVSAFANSGLNWVSTKAQGGIPRFLDCLNAVCSAGDKLEVWHGTGTPGQSWTLNNTLSSGGFCVDAAANPVGPAACNGSSSQNWIWLLDPVTNLYQLKNASTGTCLDVTGNADNDGTQLQMWSCTDSSTRWRTGSALFNLTNPGTPLSICISPLDGMMYAAGQNHSIYNRSRNATAWTLLPANSCCALSVEFGSGNVMFCVGLNNYMWTKASNDVTSAWSMVPNSSGIIDIAWNALTSVMWAIDTYNHLYYMRNGTWNMQGSGVNGLLSVSIAGDGRQWFVTTGNVLYYQTNNGGALNTIADCTPTKTTGVISVACDRFSSVIYCVTQSFTVVPTSIRQGLNAFP